LAKADIVKIKVDAEFNVCQVVSNFVSKLTMSYFPQEVEPVRKKYLTEVQKWAVAAAYNYYWNH
jgi:hypothetical protein